MSPWCCGGCAAAAAAALQGEFSSCGGSALASSYPPGEDLHACSLPPYNGTVQTPFYRYDNIFSGVLSTFIIFA